MTERLRLDIEGADCLLVVPPGANMQWPALGVHQLQASARAAGFAVEVLYVNLLFASLVGIEAYARIANAPMGWLLCDRLFARAAFGAPPLGFESARFLEAFRAHEAALPGDMPFSVDDLYRFEAHAVALSDDLASAIAESGVPVLGASTTFAQTASSLALLSRVKHLRPAVRTILGGANCEGEMAEGIRSVTGAVDHVFSGESEETFLVFLADRRAGRPTPPIVRGAPCRDMDALPTPDFAEYFDQCRRVLPDIDPESTWISFEASRGCWWGQKHHCTFCGLNGTGMAFREKSADRVIAQLTEILAQSPTRLVSLTDNIMPWRYHQTLIPRIRAQLGEVLLAGEQKANLTLAQLDHMRASGMRMIQAGIEALDSELLERMRKGVLARQNIATLRYAGSLKMRVDWNLLCGFPGEDVACYRRTLALLPKIRHLWPPHFVRVILDRFSPYFDDPAGFGITDLEPEEGYGEVFPPHTDLRKLAYRFRAKWSSVWSEAPELAAALKAEIAEWRASWMRSPQPMLTITRAGDRYVLLDTRGLATPTTVYLDEARARTLLVGRPGPAPEWALRNAWVVDLDGWSVPLAVAPPDLLAKLEAGGAAEGDVPLSVVRPL